MSEQSEQTQKRADHYVDQLSDWAKVTTRPLFGAVARYRSPCTLLSIFEHRCCTVDVEIAPPCQNGIILDRCLLVANVAEEFFRHIQKCVVHLTIIIPQRRQSALACRMSLIRLQAAEVDAPPLLRTEAACPPLAA